AARRLCSHPRKSFLRSRHRKPTASCEPPWRSIGALLERLILDHTPAGHQLPESSAATCVPCNPCCHHRQAVNLPAQLRSTPALNTPHTARWLRAISGEACLKKSVPSARASQAHCVPSFLCSKRDLTLPANLPHNEPQRRACSSVGRAYALQAGGRRFEPGHVHQPSPEKSISCQSALFANFVNLGRGSPARPIPNPARSAMEPIWLESASRTGTMPMGC